ncbi:MAG: two-component system regulatory protein YycI [Clostridia bacterium]
MDWSRAKTILIWAFLFLDLFLGYQVYATRYLQWTSTESVKNGAWDLELYLKQQNITLSSEMPQETPEMKYLNVEYQGFQLPMHMLPDQRITLQKTSIISYFVQPFPVTDVKNLEDWLQMMDQRIMYANQYHPDRRLSNSARLQYWQYHGKYPLFVSPLEFTIENNLVKKYKQTYVHIRNQGSGRQVISAYTALRSLVENEIIQPGAKIDDVTLGYYGYYYDADIQVLAPVWRFIHNGNIDYINGFTGAIERPPDDKYSMQR